MLIKGVPKNNCFVAVNNQTNVYLQSIGFSPLFVNDDGLYYYMGEERLLAILEERRNSNEV